MHNDKDLSTWQTFRRLWPTIAPFKAGLIVAGIALILNAASDTFMLSLLKPLLDDGFGKTDRSVLLWMPLVVIGLMILRGITSYISSYCISWVSGKVVMTMRRRLFGHMMGMPVAFFDKQSTGTLLSRITYDSEQVASSSSGALITVVREGASIIGLFIMMIRQRDTLLRMRATGFQRGEKARRMTDARHRHNIAQLRYIATRSRT